MSKRVTNFKINVENVNIEEIVETSQIRTNIIVLSFSYLLYKLEPIIYRNLSVNFYYILKFLNSVIKIQYDIFGNFPYLANGIFDIYKLQNFWHKYLS